MSSGGVDPITNPQVWDLILIGQTASPGIVEVSGWKRQNEWDLKKGKGTVGATLTFVGKPPAKGTFKFLLWDPLHFQQWDTFRPLLKYDPTKKSVTAVDVYHPSLADIDVTSIVVESIGAIEHEGKQLYSVTVEAIEYFPVPKKSATSSPSGSASNASGKTSTPGTLPDPVADAQQKEIERLLAEASKP